MASLGNIATGKGSVLLLKEEPGFAGTIASATSVWPRIRAYNYKMVKTWVKSEHAASNNLGFVKKAVEIASGYHKFEVDMTSIVWPLKWLMGSLVSAQVGATSEYKHRLKFGNSNKSFKAFLNEGGLASGYFRNYLGMTPNRFNMNVTRFDTVLAEMSSIGKKNEDGGAGPGSATFAAENLTAAFPGFSVWTHTAGTVTAPSLANGWDRFNDPADMSFGLMRDLKADNFIADGTGQLTGIGDGETGFQLDFGGQITDDHKIATFEANTEIALAVIIDTGVAVPSGAGNYRMELVCPRGVLDKYERPMNGPGPIPPVMSFMAMVDPTAGYDIHLDVFNNTTAYSDAT